MTTRSAFGFWSVGGDYDNITFDDNGLTIREAIDALKCNGNTIVNYGMGIETEMDPSSNPKRARVGDNGERAQMEGNKKKRNDEWILQLPHLRISRHFTNFTELRQFVIKQFQQFQTDISEETDASVLTVLANKMDPNLRLKPVIVDGNYHFGLCLSCPLISSDRWNHLPFGYAPFENPFDSDDTEKALRDINPLWRSEFATMNPSQKLLEATGTMDLFYFTETGEKRIADNLMIRRGDFLSNINPKTRVDLNEDKSDVFNDEEFTLLKNGFGPKQIAFCCELCQFTTRKNYSSWRHYLNFAQNHYKLHGDFGIAVFANVSDELRYSFFTYFSKRKEAKAIINQVHNKKLKNNDHLGCLDIEFGRSDEHGWHIDRSLTYLQRFLRCDDCLKRD